MTAVPDKPRAGSVRVFIIFGISGLILLLVGSGIFYRYFAHRWWPEFVARTTPSVGQLCELIYANASRRNDVEDILGDRLLQDPALCTRMEVELIRRFQGECAWYDLRIIKDIVMVIQEAEVELPDLWTEVYRESMTADETRRIVAVNLLGSISRPLSVGDGPLMMWQCYMRNRDIADNFVPGTGPEFTVEYTLAGLCAAADDARLISWIKTLDIQSDLHLSMNFALTNGIHDNPRSPYIGPIIKNVNNGILGKWHDDHIVVISFHKEWKDECIQLMEGRPELTERMISAWMRNDDAVGQGLDFMLEHPAHAELVWLGLLEEEDEVAIRELPQRWDSVVIQLERESAPACDALAARVVARLRFAPALPWLRRQLQRPPAQCTATVIECLGTMGESDDLALVYPHVFDQRYQQVAGWALRHLDGAAARQRVVAEIWADSNPGDRLLALSFVCEDEPYGQIIEDPRFQGIGVDSPLVQALLTMGLTSEQRQRVLTLAQ